MYKIITEIKGQLWSVVNTQNIKEIIHGWFSYTLAKDCRDALNNGTANINDYI